MRGLIGSVAAALVVVNLTTGCASGPSPEEIERLERQRQQAEEAQRAMEERKRQEQARQQQAQRDRVAIDQAEQKAAAVEKTGNLRGALTEYAVALRQLEVSSLAFQAVIPAEFAAVGQRLRGKIFALAQRLDPPPAPAEEAERHVIRGQMAFKTAKSTEEYSEAAKEFKQATLLAPWWPDPYFNLGLAQAQAGKLDEAVASLKSYVLGAPNAPDVKEVKTKIVELEYTKEQAVRRIQGWQGLYRITQSESQYLEHMVQCGTPEIVRKFNMQPSLHKMPLELVIGSVDMATKQTTGRLLRSSMDDGWAGTVNDMGIVLHAGSPSENVIEIKRTADSLQLQAKVRYHIFQMLDNTPCHSWGKYDGPIEKVSDAKPR